MRNGGRMGDRVVRRPRQGETAPVRLRVGRRRRIVVSAAASSMLLLTLGFAAAIAVGTLLLSLPFASVPERGAPLLTALFTATSATCVTGLVMVESATYWSGFGQAVIAALMFMGGLGIMTAGVVILVAIGRRVTLSDRLTLRESMGEQALGSVTRFGRNVILFAVAAQVAGLVLLATHFIANYGFGEALWHSLFLSVSAFNNAGFNIVEGSDSLSLFSGSPMVIVSVGVLILLGSMSLPVLADIVRKRRLTRLSLETQLVLVGLLGLWALGAAAMFAFEFRNPATLGEMGLGDRLTNALFQATVSRTAGFSTIDFGSTRGATDHVFLLLMAVGGVSGSTAGGIKINTLMVLLVAAYASLQGRPHPEVFRRELPYAQIARAIALVALVTAVFMAVVVALAATENANITGGRFSFADLLFEAVSALGTVGLSRGITGELSDPGHYILTAAMYVGRLGPLTLGLGLAFRERRAVYRFAQERVRIG